MNAAGHIRAGFYMLEAAITRVAMSVLPGAGCYREAVQEVLAMMMPT